MSYQARVLLAGRKQSTVRAGHASCQAHAQRLHPPWAPGPCPASAHVAPSPAHLSRRGCSTLLGREPPCGAAHTPSVIAPERRRRAAARSAGQRSAGQGRAEQAARQAGMSSLGGHVRQASRARPHPHPHSLTALHPTSLPTVKSSPHCAAPRRTAQHSTSNARLPALARLLAASCPAHLRERPLSHRCLQLLLINEVVLAVAAAKEEVRGAQPLACMGRSRAGQAGVKCYCLAVLRCLPVLEASQPFLAQVNAHVDTLLLPHPTAPARHTPQHPTSHA